MPSTEAQMESLRGRIASSTAFSEMSSLVQSFYNVSIVREVSKEFFSPVPKVDGAVIRFQKRADVDTKDIDFGKYEKFLHHAYKNPRKMLNKAFSKEDLAKAGLVGTVRPQNVSADKWLFAFKALK